MNTDNNNRLERGAVSPINIKLPLLSFHPYNDISFYNRKQRHYSQFIPLTSTDIYNHGNCEIKRILLPYTSNLLNKNIFIEIYQDLNQGTFVRRLDRFLVSGSISNSTKFSEKYLIHLAAKELYNRVTNNVLNWIPYKVKEFIDNNEFTTPYLAFLGLLYRCHNTNPFLRSDWIIPDEFRCSCEYVWSSNEPENEIYSDSEDFEPTAFIECITNLGKSIAASGTSTFYAFKAADFDFVSASNEFVADLTLLIVNFNIYTFVWAFIKLINKVVKLPSILEAIAKTFTEVYNKLCNFLPTQQTSGDHESTNWISDLKIPSIIDETSFTKFFKDIKDTIPAICAAAATVLVTIIAVFMGKNVFDDPTLRLKSKAFKISQSFMTLSKTGSSIKNLFNILTEWPKWIHRLVMEHFMLDDDCELLRLLDEVEVITPEGVEKKDFFEKIAFLTNPINLLAISREEQYRNELVWCDNILNQMAKIIAIRPLEQRSSISQWIYTKLQHTRSTLMSMARLPCHYQKRFQPFWINIIGPSGCGKTRLSPRILDVIRDLLAEWEEHENTIENERLFTYSMNFCSKYMTGYAGQYSVLIDDLFQDAQTVGDATPSALLLIQMVSSQPYYTIQASLEDKGTEFTSKIILSTSNDYNMQRKEICDRNALLRRMNVRIHMDYAGPKDEIDEAVKEFGLEKNVVFQVCEPINGKMIYKFNFKQLCTYIASEYCKWYITQQRILNQKTSSVVNVDAVIESMNKDYLPELKPIGLSEQLARDYITPAYKPYDFVKKSLIKQPINKKDTQTLTPTIEDQKPSTSTDISNFEPTQSWRCKLNMYNIIEQDIYVLDEYITVPAKIQQYNCDCDECISINRSYRDYQVRYYCTTMNIPTLSEFIKTTSTCRDPLTHSLIDKMKNIWNKVKQLLSEVSKHPITIILSSLAVIGSIYFISRSTSDSSNHTTFIQTGLPYSSGNIKSRITPRVKVQKLQPVKFVSTNYSALPEDLRVALPNQNTYDVLQKILGRESLCVVRLMKDDQMFICNSAIRIVDTCILTNHHFIMNLQRGDEFEIILYNKIKGQTIKKQVFDPSKYRQLGGIDAGVYQCDNCIPHSASIIDHFMDENVPDFEHEAIMLSIFDPSHLVCPVVIPGIQVKPYKIHSEYEKGLTTLNTYESNLDVIRGQSGSILISTEPHAKNKIIGILVCRSKISSKGYFKPISKTDLLTAIQSFNIDENLETTHTEDMEICCAASYKEQRTDIIECNSLNYLGLVPLNNTVRQPNRSKFVPSVIQDTNNLKFQPAVLDPLDPRLNEDVKGKSIIFRALKGYDDPIGSIDPLELSIATDELSIDLYNRMIPPPSLKRSLLNDYQMVNGVSPYLSKLDMRTSPGYPYVLQKDHELGKLKWFNQIDPHYPHEGNVYEMKEELAQKVKYREDKARKGIKIPTIAYMCLKDEVRPLEKVKTGSTRIFTCLPMDYNLLIRKYFGAFIITQHHNAGYISSSVGINPSKDWYQIHRRLYSKNVLWEDFDYKNWDQHLHPSLVMKVADVVSYWYGDEFDSPSAKVRRVLLHDLIHTTILVKDHLFVKSTGQCSGCAITAELNCMVHEILLYYVFRKICKKRKISPTISFFRESIETAIYGDDIVLSALPEVYDFFNGKTIKPEMDKIGMQITPGDKQSTEFLPKFPSEIYFLKRRFTIDEEESTLTELEPYNCRAPLRQDIIDNIWQWISGKEDSKIATLTNCETSLREYFMYGRKEFNIQKSNLNQRIKQYNEKFNQNMNLITINYDNLLQDYREGRFDIVGLNTISRLPMIEQ